MLTKEMGIEYINIEIQGVVQGRGFRPFLYRLADQYQLKGLIRNEGSYVRAQLKGHKTKEFLNELKEYKITHSPTIDPGNKLYIANSKNKKANSLTILKDLSSCRTCLSEFYDPDNKRYLYPFISCHDCGPRFSIMESFPYDRKKTSYKNFIPCSFCQSEYNDPSNRRFYHQSICCPNCGPQLDKSLEEIIKILEDNKIIAFKSLGGFQLICQTSAIERLRLIKNRAHKAFALMRIEGSEAISIQECQDEKQQLLAPDTYTLGVMKATTAFHHLLCKRFGELIVTSANIDGPMITEFDEVLLEMSDLVVCHDRKIQHRLEDSIYLGDRPIRLGRAYAPMQFPFNSKPMIALGGDLKNSFGISNGHIAAIFGYIGNLHHPKTFNDFKLYLNKAINLFDIQNPTLICDKHPDYLSHQYAHKLECPIVEVPHHLAHGASVMMENNLKKCLAICFDGTGYGDDGTIWGGEGLFIDYDNRSYKRLFSLTPWPLLGGEKAVYHPYRNTYAFLNSLGLKKDTKLETLMKRQHLFPKTSSMGRLFDAVGAFVLPEQYQTISYEAQAAIALEKLAMKGVNNICYPLIWKDNLLDTYALFYSIYKDSRSKEQIAYSFHLSIAQFILEMAQKAGEENIALGGGVFQNQLLFSISKQLLEKNNFKVFYNLKVPCNDSGLSLGQLYWGALYA
ncbi:MAG: carbamoyltransferase HypF [Bacteriovoracaceae bacterium]